MDEIAKSAVSILDIVREGGALVLLALVIIGFGWLLIKGFKALKEFAKTQADALEATRIGFERMLTQQRQDSISTLTQHRNEHLKALDQHRSEHTQEIKVLRESLVASLDRNTQATNMLTNALITQGGTKKT